jgi:hypothetical protein
MAFYREDRRPVSKVSDFRGNFKAVMISLGQWSVINSLASCFGGALQQLLNHYMMDDREALKIIINRPRVCIRLGTIDDLTIPATFAQLTAVVGLL